MNKKTSGIDRDINRLKELYKSIGDCLREFERIGALDDYDTDQDIDDMYKTLDDFQGDIYGMLRMRGVDI